MNKDENDIKTEYLTFREFEIFRELETEREKRYTERFTAQERALDKAQNAQAEYDKHHNNLVAETVSQNMYSNKIQEIENKIERDDNAIHEISKILSATSGGVLRGSSDQTRQQWVVATTVGIIVFIVGFIFNCIGLSITLYLNFIPK